MVAIFVSNMAQKEFYLKHIGSSIQFQIVTLCLFFLNLHTTTASCIFSSLLVLSTPRHLNPQGLLPLSLGPDGLAECVA